MTVRTYCYLQLAHLAIDCTIVGAWQLVTGDYAVVPAAMLGLKLGLDLVFVLWHLGRVRLSLFEWTMAGWVLFAALLGSVNWVRSLDGYSMTRAVKDTLPAVFFFLKLGIFRSLPLDLATHKLVRMALAISIANIAVYYAFGGFSLGHVGLTPPIKYPVVWYLVGRQALPLLLCFAILVISGKRAFFLSAALYAWATILIGLSRNLLSRAPWRLLTVFLLATVAVAVIPSPIQRKIETTVEGLRDGLKEDSEETPTARADSRFYSATAGRSAEIGAIWERMDTRSILVGKGAGFTYQLELADGVVIDAYANAHFSPLGLCYKYGAPFAVVFYLWLIATVWPRRRWPATTDRRFWRGVGFLIIAESIFAFNLFVEPLLPLALAVSRKNDEPQPQT